MVPSMSSLQSTLSYFSSLILVEGMDVDFLHKCALEDRTERHQFFGTPDVCKVSPNGCSNLLSAYF